MDDLVEFIPQPSPLADPESSTPLGPSWIIEVALLSSYSHILWGVLLVGLPILLLFRYTRAHLDVWQRRSLDESWKKSLLVACALWAGASELTVLDRHSHYVFFIASAASRPFSVLQGEQMVLSLRVGELHSVFACDRVPPSR